MFLVNIIAMHVDRIGEGNEKENYYLNKHINTLLIGQNIILKQVFVY